MITAMYSLPENTCIILSKLVITASSTYPADIYLFKLNVWNLLKVNNKDTRPTSDIVYVYLLLASCSGKTRANSLPFPYVNPYPYAMSQFQKMKFCKKLQ